MDANIRSRARNGISRCPAVMRSHAALMIADIGADLAAKHPIGPPAVHQDHGQEDERAARFSADGKRAITMQKSVASLLAFASLLIAMPSFAFDGVKVAGTAEKLRLEVSNATVDNALAALRSAVDFKCLCSPPLDRRVTGVYQGNIGRVLSRLLEGYDYVIKTSPSGIFTFPSQGIAAMPLIENEMSVSFGPLSRTRSVRCIRSTSGCMARLIFA